jgi:chromosome segregation ATPase
VLSRNDGDEYQEPRDIIKRWMTLKDNTTVLQTRKTQLEEDLLRTRSSLNLARQRRSTENIALQNRLNELQMTFESLQKSIKAKQDELERKVKQKSSTTRTVSHVTMATTNLYDRCVTWTREFSGRGKVETPQNSVLHQLHVICDCLEDFQTIIQQHQEQQRVAAVAAAGAVGGQQSALKAS